MDCGSSSAAGRASNDAREDAKGLQRVRACSTESTSSKRCSLRKRETYTREKCITTRGQGLINKQTISRPGNPDERQTLHPETPD